MSGEASQEKGREGARLAKKWLERSTRVNVTWVNPDKVAIPKLTLDKARPVGQSKDFSFDLGGYLRGEDIDGQTFLAECKNYKDSSDQGNHYSAFLAHCYRAAATNHLLGDNFFWITYAPFNVTTWDQLASKEKVRKSVLDNPDVNFCEGEDPIAVISQEIVCAVSERLWMLVLSEKQIEHLVLTANHHSIIEQDIIRNGWAGK
ncbi:hypothetical protein [Nocardia brasiliensis]|uniref:hypothetical protein n=1 Tax=Nocardia brasiliensis TaxID=37326 RepID=UPI0004A6E84A|nr:hypothetical protein [Nocardia brasiliensis]